jgi:hypothetical protein
MADEVKSYVMVFGKREVNAQGRPVVELTKRDGSSARYFVAQADYDKATYAPGAKVKVTFSKDKKSTIDAIDMAPAFEGGQQGGGFQKKFGGGGYSGGGSSSTESVAAQMMRATEGINVNTAVSVFNTFCDAIDARKKKYAPAPAEASAATAAAPAKKEEELP